MKLSPEIEVYLWQGVMDIQRSFDLLSQFVKEWLQVPATSGAVFIFFFRYRSKVMLYWDRDGYAVWHKRLEAGKYRIETTEGTQKISAIDLESLLLGVDLSRINLRVNVSSPEKCLHVVAADSHTSIAERLILLLHNATVTPSIH